MHMWKDHEYASNLTSQGVYYIKCRQQSGINSNLIKITFIKIKESIIHYREDCFLI